MSIQAAVVETPGRMVVREVEEGTPFGTRPVLVRIGGVGLCGSDLLRYAHGTAYHYPLVLGHEFSGVVEQAPANARLAVGTKVAVFPLLPPAGDPLVEVGEWALSTGYDYYGSRRDGALQELLWVPERNLIPVPADLSLVRAALVEPAAVALHGVGKLTVPACGTALVVGAGPIGALAAQWLRLAGWNRVIVAEVDERKRAVMAQLGFETVPTQREALDLAGPGGVDAAVEATGVPDCLIGCLEAAGPQGQVLILGDVKGDVTLPRELVSSLIRRELTVRGTWNSRITPAGRSDWDRAVAAIADGRLAVDPIISTVAALDDAPEVLDAMARRAGWFNKVVFAVSTQARAETPLNWRSLS
jgi:L-iditol 2-dehydrogenase/galactitol-1-phosphate 5-dehydrogenase